MGALLSLPITLLNFLLPFTKPGTPILQDLVHTAILCGTLYYGPQIAEWYNAQQPPQAEQQGQGQNGTAHEAEDVGTAPQHIPAAEGAEDAAPGDHNAFQAQIEDEDEAPLPQPGPADPLNEAHAFAAAQEAEAGPANLNERPRATPANRAVGAKKAKSLARKDQRRAYHEFHRQEAELRRLQEAEGREEREAALAAEKARRAAAEAEIVERERRERERVKEEREKEAAEEAERRERVVRNVREGVEARGAVDLGALAWEEGKDTLWVERLVRASGVLKVLEGEGDKVVITRAGWVVRVDRELLRQASREAEVYGEGSSGHIGFGEFGGMLERAVRARGGF
ncbi:hypothetical protein B5807_06856 [Epicoccum nigrum]|uniref:Uncharacterized protein n=1 Tax=Epicoccum nigrum TaxID=105696 RepID=A0A1Y2LY93_EPING|nr:hypothetical protein B5807_06856 [Epicoccum nigrum]